MRTRWCHWVKTVLWENLYYLCCNSFSGFFFYVGKHCDVVYFDVTMFAYGKILEDCSGVLTPKTSFVLVRMCSMVRDVQSFKNIINRTEALQASAAFVKYTTARNIKKVIYNIFASHIKAWSYLFMRLIRLFRSFLVRISVYIICTCSFNFFYRDKTSVRKRGSIWNFAIRVSWRTGLANRANPRVYLASLRLYTNSTQFSPQHTGDFQWCLDVLLHFPCDKRLHVLCLYQLLNSFESVSDSILPHSYILTIF